MDNLNNPCGEEYGTAGPVWNTFPADYGDVKHLRNYRFNKAHTEMYFAPDGPLNRPVLVIRWGNGEGETEIVPLNLNPREEIDDYRGSPEMKQLFEIAYACAEQKGYIA